MASCHVHITGASGSGTTTLGRTLATELAIPHHDTDDYYWMPTHPPFTEQRPAVDRLPLMERLFLPRAGWVLSGSLVGWGDPLIPLFDLVVYLRAPTELRAARLRAREARTFGVDATRPGGWRNPETEAFVAWASAYDAGPPEGRSRAKHERWLAALPCPVLWLDGSRPVSELASSVTTRLPRIG